jgi:chemotaxis protein CheZ
MDQAALVALEQIVEKTVRNVVGSLNGDLHKFVDRRFDEVSSELHAVLEFFDISENKVQDQLQAMRADLSQVIDRNPDSHHVNSGFELEAIVQITEGAANKIMGSAEKITEALSNSGMPAETTSAIQGEINVIFEACGFQDMTSQRVRRTIGKLAKIESLLRAISNKAELAHHVPGASGTVEIHQFEVDALFAA